MNPTKLQLPASIARVLAAAGASIVLPTGITPEAIQSAAKALDRLDRMACAGECAARLLFPEGIDAPDLVAAASVLSERIAVLGLVDERPTVPAGWDVDVGSRIFVVAAPDPATAEDFAEAVTRDDVDASNMEHTDGDTSVLFWFDSDDRSDCEIRAALIRVVTQFVDA